MKVLLAACALALAGPVAAQAATFPVNTTADDSSTPTGTATSCPSTCTLRDAVIAANNTSGDNTITLPAGHYTLSIAPSNPTNDATTGDLNIVLGDTLTINGPGASTTTIDGGGIDRVFNVASGGSLTLTGATVTGGQPASSDSVLDGGGFLNAGTLTLTSDVVSGNQAPSGQGGGANQQVAGTTTVTSSTFSSNTAGSSTATFGAGGGIHTDVGVGGTLTVSASTFTGNVAESNASNCGCGGALDLDGGAAAITNSTLAGNSASGGNPGGGAVDIDTFDAVQFSSDTIAFNTEPVDVQAPTQGDGAGVWSGARSNVQFQNTIIAHNTRTTGDGTNITGSESQDCDATTNSNPGNNLDDDNTCFTGANDLHADPQLSPLASNGGPTQTHAIAATSPARDAGDAGTCPSMDQRGVTRPVGSTCDIGAFELDPPVNTAAPAISGTPQPSQTLTCSKGSWSGSPFQSYSYQWKRTGVAISGGTSSTYTISSADVGHEVTCTVTSSTIGDGSASATSAPVQVFVAPPSNAFSFGKLFHHKRKGTATQIVKVSGRGTLVLKGKGVRTVQKTVSSGGKVKLTIALTRKLARKLKAKGTLKVKIMVIYTPTGGTPNNIYAPGGGTPNKKTKKIKLIEKRRHH